MGSRKLPKGVTKLKNGTFRVRFSKGGVRYEIGTYKKRQEALDALGKALWNLPDDNDPKLEKTPQGEHQYNPAKETVKTRLRRLVKKFKNYLRSV